MQIIDRRLNQKNKSTVNRQRFLKRYRKQIKKAINKQIGQRSITDIDKDEKISIPTKDISEPTFNSGSGGRRERVFPGNKEFVSGDQIKRPPQQQGGGGGGEASNDGEGEDEFVFQISSDEYMEILFEGLELPNLKKNQLKKTINYKTIRSGFNTEGTPSNIDIVRSFKGSMARRIACQAPIKKQIKEKQTEFDETQLPEEKERLRLETLHRYF